MARRFIHLIERNIRGAVVIYGALGVRQYYDYTETEARRRYIADCKSTFITNQKRARHCG